MGLLERGIQTDIIAVLKKLDVIPTHRSYRLGEVKNFGTLVAAAQREGVPIYLVKAATPPQRAQARAAFQDIANKIVKQTG